MSRVLTGDPTHITTPLAATVTALANASGIVRVTTSAPHLYGPGDTVNIQTTTLAGVFAVTVIDATHFDLQGSTWTSGYGGGTGTATDLSITPQVLVPTDGDTFSLQLSGALSSIQALLDRTQYVNEEISVLRAELNPDLNTIPALNWGPEFAVVNTVSQQAIGWNPQLNLWMMAYTEVGGSTDIVISLGLDQGAAAAWPRVGSSFSGAATAVWASVCADPSSAGVYWVALTDSLGSNNHLTVFKYTGSWSDTPGTWTSVTAASVFYGVEIIPFGSDLIMAVAGSGTGDSKIYFTANGFTTFSSFNTTHPVAAGGTWNLKSNGSMLVAIQNDPGNNYVYSSTDGHTWTTSTSLQSQYGGGWNVAGLAWTEDIAGPCWIACVSDGSGAPKFLRSIDGVLWRLQSGGMTTTETISEMASVNGTLVCTLADVGSGGPSGSIFSADGGITWYFDQANFTSNITGGVTRSRVASSGAGFMMANGKFARFSSLLGLNSTARL